MDAKCLHQDCNNDLPEDGSCYPYCSFTCWLSNNVDLGMSLKEAKAKVSQGDDEIKIPACEEGKHRYNRELSVEECVEKGIQHYGMFCHVQECGNCGYIRSVDSSG